MTTLEQLKAWGYKHNSLMALRQAETIMTRANTDYVNGDITEYEHENIKMRISNRVASAFGGVQPKGFFINTDPRGYALKISDTVMREAKNAGVSIALTQDWGGYGILARAN